ncbi:uncharacterized protein LOC143711269 isoform X2 [Siphateles boraxobius]|uniref:uncharacterized protein LOC143711269 isoform X2 n=1 Tax=Siphateles boraxobius TaxID=180520 RepID=UPI004063F800
MKFFFCVKKRKEALLRAQRISEKKSAMSERELKAGNDWANFKAWLKVQNAPEAKQAVQDVNRRPLETEEELKALGRKVSELLIKCEETEPEEEQEMDRVLMMGLSETIMWEYLNLTKEMQEENKVFKCEKEKMKEKADRSKEEVNNNLIEQQQEELKIPNSLVRSGKSENISRRRNVRQKIFKKMADVYLESFGHYCSPDFPDAILSDFEDWSLDLSEDMPPETLHNLLMQISKDFAMCERLQKQAEAEALREERRQKRLESALAPLLKITGKKLMPRSQPPKKVIKKEAVETKNQEYADIYSLFEVLGPPPLPSPRRKDRTRG